MPAYAKCGTKCSIARRRGTKKEGNIIRRVDVKLKAEGRERELQLHLFSLVCFVNPKK